MRPFFAIVKLTFKHALRSHIFQLLLGVLVFAVLFIPTTVGAGTASDFIRVSLLYSLWAVSVILALSSIWLGCFVMTTDVDSYQLHMIVSKPVSKVIIWLGKWTGVNLINLILLLVSSLFIYGIIQYRFSREDFPEEEREKIRNEVMAGRRVFPAMRPDYGLLSREALKRRIIRLQSQGTNVDTSPAAQEKMLKDVRREVVSADSEVKAGQRKVWQFGNLPENLKTPIYLRYRPYDQRRLLRCGEELLPHRERKDHLRPQRNHDQRQSGRSSEECGSHLLRDGVRRHLGSALRGIRRRDRIG